MPSVLWMMALWLVACVLAACSTNDPESEATVAPAAVEQPPLSGFRQALQDLDIASTIPVAGRAIVVNVPAFELIALEDGEPVLRSRVIVGSRRHLTPLIETYTTAVRFRPSWRPTPSMVASGEYEDRRWPPGRKNPLGLAAIRLEPGLLVYLHDTNRRTLFEKDMRALSHGCIRVQRWDELIAWLLEIDVEEVHRHANGRRTFDMPTEEIPVLIGYFTVFPNDEGTLVQFDDIYRREPKGTAQAKAARASKMTTPVAECVGG